jgi:PncC family amidohydrolase
VKPSELLRALARRGLRLATVESCTGGLLGAEITSVPGSSEVYLGGWVAYSNALKVSQVGVPARLVERGGPGAVSREAAEAMARGGLRRSDADLCVSITGIAGPGGGTRGKPVGTVWIAVASRKEVVSRRFRFDGGRARVRKAAANEAMAMVLGAIGAVS